MIIVKTSNGDHFINDKAVTEVSHNRESKTVDYYGSNGVFNNIKDVEGIIYTNEAQPTSWTDEGSELRRAERNKEIADLQYTKVCKELNYTRSFYREANMALMEICDNNLSVNQRKRYDDAQAWIKRGWDEMNAKLKELDEQIEELQNKPL